MTTSVIIKAHCSAEKEVAVAVTDNGSSIEAFVLQDGEVVERVVYDGRAIHVAEQLKEVAPPADAPAA